MVRFKLKMQGNESQHNYRTSGWEKLVEGDWSKGITELVLTFISCSFLSILSLIHLLTHSHTYIHKTHILSAVHVDFKLEADPAPLSKIWSRTLGVSPGFFSDLETASCSSSPCHGNNVRGQRSRGTKMVLPQQRMLKWGAATQICLLWFSASALILVAEEEA